MDAQLKKQISDKTSMLEAGKSYGKTIETAGRIKKCVKQS